MSPSSTQPPASTRAALLGLIGELGQQTGLADPGITGQQHNLRAAVLGLVQSPLESAQLKPDR